MSSAPGYVFSGRVDDLAAELNKQMTAIAIGKLYKSGIFLNTNYTLSLMTYTCTFIIGKYMLT